MVHAMIYRALLLLLLLLAPGTSTKSMSFTVQTAHKEFVHDKASLLDTATYN